LFNIVKKDFKLILSKEADMQEISIQKAREALTQAGEALLSQELKTETRLLLVWWQRKLKKELAPKANGAGLDTDEVERLVSSIRQELRTLKH
jgi:hypothetical protein